ncbi:tetratricopeptide repeat protein [bacterium]|nr:tetratricopeptide repeat protein [bacterium]
MLFVLAWVFPKLAYHRDHPTVWSRLSIESSGILKLRESASVSQRLLIWGASLRMFRQSPIFGHGWGSFEIRYPIEQGKIIAEKPEFGGLRTHANNSHNELLEQLSQLGIVGFSLFAFIWGVFFYRTAKSYFAGGSLLLLGCVSAVAGFMTDNILGVTLNFPMPVMAFWAAAGIAVAESSQGEYLAVRKVHMSAALKIVLAALTVFFIKKQADYFKGEMSYFSGFAASRRGNIKQAAEDCLKSWQYYAWNTDNNYELGNCYMRLGQYDKAVWAYKEALKANPGYDEIYYNLAIAYQSMGALDDAEKNYREAAAINPVSAEYFLALGNHYLRNEKTKDIKKAEEFYLRAFELKPDSADIANNLAYVYMVEKNINKSYELYKKALEINPAYETAKKNLQSILPQLGIPVEKWRAKALAAVERKDFAAAEPLFRKIQEANPGDTAAIFYLGNCLTSMNRYDDAAAIYEKLVKFYPEEKNFALNLAKIYYMKGDRIKAAEFLREIYPRFPEDKEIKKFIDSLRREGVGF